MTWGSYFTHQCSTKRPYFVSVNQLTVGWVHPMEIPILHKLFQFLPEILDMHPEEHTDPLIIWFGPGL